MGFVSNTSAKALGELGGAALLVTVILTLGPSSRRRFHFQRLARAHLAAQVFRLPERDLYRAVV